MRIPLLLAALLALPAAAQDLRPADADRLGQWEAHFGRAMIQALAGGAPADVAALAGVMAGAPGPLDPAGDWSCRTFKLGELSPLVAYPPFRCRITETAPGTWRIEKLTGSQRLAGSIHAVEGDAIYLGVGFVEGGPATDYAGLPPDDQTPVEPGQTVAQVGFLEQPAPDRARLLLPDPILESAFDVLALSR